MISETDNMHLVLVNYFNDSEVIEFIDKQLLQQEIIPKWISVVNNGSHNSGKLRTECENRKVFFLQPEGNVGYLGGLLYAFNASHQKSAEWFILSNTDIKFLSKDFFWRFNKKSYDSKVVLVGPSIKTPSGAEQNPMYINRISIAKLKRLRAIFSYYVWYFFYQIFAVAKQTLGQSRTKNMSSQYAYAIHGSFQFIKSDFIKKNYNELSRAPFLFGEELCFAEAAFKQNDKLYVDFDMKVLHLQHSTTGTFKSRKSVKLLHAAVNYFVEQRNG